MQILDRAILLATQAHIRQTRKYEINGGKLPFITHPLEVMKLAWKWGAGDPVTLAAAALHDAFEDTELSRAEVERLSPEVCAVVEQLTCLPDTPKADYLAGFLDQRKTSTRALIIKVADRICNVRDFARNDPVYAVKYLRQATVLSEALQARKSEVESLWGRVVYVGAANEWLSTANELINR